MGQRLSGSAAQRVGKASAQLPRVQAALSPLGGWEVHPSQDAGAPSHRSACFRTAT